MTLQPMYDRILVKRKTAENKTKSGIFTGDGKTKSNYAVVVAVGDGRLNEDNDKVTPLKVTVGMTVLLGKWAGDEVKIDDVEHLMIRESEVLAIAHDGK